MPGTLILIIDVVSRPDSFLRCECDILKERSLCKEKHLYVKILSFLRRRVGLRKNIFLSK